MPMGIPSEDPSSICGTQWEGPTVRIKKVAQHTYLPPSFLEESTRYLPTMLDG